jgi:hypothetical protein
MSDELESSVPKSGVGSVKSDLELTGVRLQQAQEAAQVALDEARRAALDAVEEGASEGDVARLLGVDPLTVQEWVGNR